MPWFCPACRAALRTLIDSRTKAPQTLRCDLCRLELHFDGNSDRMRDHGDDDELIVRPAFDRRSTSDAQSKQAGERRQRERRRRVTIH